MTNIYYEIDPRFEGKSKISYYDYMELHPYDRHKYNRVSLSTPCANHDRETVKDEEELTFSLEGRGINFAPLIENYEQ